MPRDTTPVLLPKGQLNKWNPAGGVKWASFQANDNSGVHFVPLNDDIVHDCRSTCTCVPMANTHGVWVHNSFDCREEYEEGFRKRH